MFHFRQFSIEDRQSAMKIGTDAVLLGSWVLPGNPLKILDVGTGCGIIALMMAQRTHARIDAVEIDSSAALEASENVNRSPWPARIHIIHSSFQSFAATTEPQYDLLISNPPFFTNSLKSPDSSRNLSRHNDQLPVTAFLKGAAQCLTEKGKFAVIVPFSDESDWVEEACQQGFHLQRKCEVIPREGKVAARVMIEFSRSETTEIICEQLLIRSRDGNYTREYIELTNDFYPGL